MTGGGGPDHRAGIAPDDVLALLVRLVGDQLGADTLVVGRVEGDGVVPLDLYDADPGVRAALAGLLGAGPLAVDGTAVGEVIRGGEPVLRPQVGPGDEAPGLLAAAASGGMPPVRSLMAVPVVDSGRTVGVLLATRRRQDPFGPADLATARAAAPRLAAAMAGRVGPTVEATHGAGSPSTPGPGPQGRGRTPWATAAGYAVAALLPLATAMLISRAEDYRNYRPGTVLLGTVVVVAATLGLRAGAVTTVVASGAVWFAFSQPRWSITFSSASSALSVAIFVVVASGVLSIVARLERSRRDAELEQRVADALIDGAPVGIGMFDTDLRFLRVNPRLAQIDGMPAAAHLGARPGDLSPLAGQLYEAALAQVRDTGDPVTGRPMSLELPERGVEWHWRANYYPVRGADRRVVAVGATVEDVTGDVVARRRADQLLRFARQLAGVVDDRDFVQVVPRFLGEVFGARAAVGLIEPGGLRLRAPAHGYPDELVEVWTAGPVPLPAPGLMGEAVELREVRGVADQAEFELRYPDLAEAWSLVGDEACLCVPVLDPADDRALAVLRVGWTHPRPITDTTVTFCQTVASMAALALRRIQLGQALEQDRFRAGLEAMLDDVAIGSALRDPSGRIVDFRLDFVSTHSRDGAGRTAAELQGARVLELYPGWVESGQFDRFCAVVQTGQPWVAERFPYSDQLEDGTTIEGFWNLQVVKLGDGYIAASRDVTEVVRLEEAEREARRVAEREQVAVQLLQRAALPVRLPEVPGVSLGARYQPADTEQPVGGDWYDAFALPDGRLALVIADVAGHGPDAAAFMVQVRNILRGVAAEQHRPDEVLRRANAVTVGFNDPGGPFVTCCYGVLDPRTRTFEWAVAGHPPPLVAGTGGAWFPEQQVGLPLAVVEDAAYAHHRVELSRGDRLVLFTDGLVERRGELLDEGLERLRSSVVGRAHTTPQELADALGAGVADPFDDLAVVVVELT